MLAGLLTRRVPCAVVASDVVSPSRPPGSSSPPVTARVFTMLKRQTPRTGHHSPTVTLAPGDDHGRISHRARLRSHAVLAGSAARAARSTRMASRVLTM